MLLRIFLALVLVLIFVLMIAMSHPVKTNSDGSQQLYAISTDSYEDMTEITLSCLAEDHTIRIRNELRTGFADKILRRFYFLECWTNADT